MTTSHEPQVSPKTTKKTPDPVVAEAAPTTVAPGDGYAAQSSSVKPGAMGYGSQAAAVSPLSDVGAKGPAPKGTGSTDWSKIVHANFSKWDKDGNGYISKGEANTLLTDPSIKGADAAAVAALHKYLSELEELSNDEWGDEDDGLTEKDLAEFDKKPIKGVDAIHKSGARKIKGQSRELFPKGVPSLSALRQGPLGDCYFLAALGSLIAKDPSAIGKMIQEHKRGTPPKPFAYTVTFPGRGKVVVAPPTDAEIARYSSSGADGLWLPVLEKAYAEARVGDDSKVNRQDEIGEGDSVAEGIATLSSSGTDTDILSLTSLETTKTKLDAAFPKGKQKKMVTALIKSENDLKLPKHHVYSVIGWKGDKIKLRNPWGYNPKGAPGEADGIFELELAKFDDIFSHISYEE